MEKLYRKYAVKQYPMILVVNLYILLVYCCTMVKFYFAVNCCLMILVVNLCLMILVVKLQNVHVF